MFSREEAERRESRAAAHDEAVRAAEASVRAAEYQVSAVVARLEGMRQARETPGEPLELRAPVDGVVLRRLRESASPVRRGEPLVEIANTAALEVVADFLSADAVRMEPGMPVRFERWGGDAPLSGRVRRVEPAGFMKVSALGVEEQRVNVIIDFDEPQEAFGKLGDGFRVEVGVVIWSGEEILTVPTASLVREGTNWSVYAVAEGRARQTAVSIGAMNGSHAELLTDLDAGTKVVLHPPDELTDGARITD